MKAWHINNEKSLELIDGSIAPKEGEIKVKLAKAALSAFDMSCFAERREEGVSVPAHSGVAHVSEACDEYGLKLGAKVVISPFVKLEEHGETVVKTLGVDMNGLLQDFVSLPVENVLTLPDGIPDEEALFAEYIAIGNKVFSALPCDEGDYVVIVGAGTLGLILCQLAIYYQMVPVLIDLDPEKLALARKWDVSYTLNPTFDNLERRVEEITGGRMSEAAVFTSEGASLTSALRLVKNGSEVIIAGHCFKSAHNVDTEIILKKGLKVKGVRDGYGEMTSAINLLANSIIKVDGIITKSTGFENAGGIFDECVKYPYKYNTVLFDFD